MKFYCSEKMTKYIYCEGSVFFICVVLASVSENVSSAHPYSTFGLAHPCGNLAGDTRFAILKKSAQTQHLTFSMPVVAMRWAAAHGTVRDCSASAP